MNELHLFAGAGGGILGGQLLGHTTVCAVEIEEYPRRVLLQRQRDGVLPKFPIWDDVCTFDGKPWRGTVDVICGGFPCQDISSAGRGAGIGGKRSGLWKEYARIIDEIRPKIVFAENSPLLRGRGLDVVLGDLSELGYDARWCVLGAWHVGAPHKRNRMWVLASNTRCKQERAVQGVQPEIKESKRKDASNISSLRPARSNMADTDNSRCKKQRLAVTDAQEHKAIRCGSYWHTDPAEICDTSEPRFSDGVAGSVGESGTVEESKRPTRDKGDWPAKPIMGRVAHGVARRVDRLKAIGNGQVPAVAATAWNILNEGLD
tara:strand:- start:5300 stop:6253 length:954 start_codon:yes stop_codon:yes gene_type:complete